MENSEKSELQIQNEYEQDRLKDYVEDSIDKLIIDNCEAIFFSLPKNEPPVSAYVGVKVWKLADAVRKLLIDRGAIY